jgi:hypothetical protein
MPCDRACHSQTEGALEAGICVAMGHSLGEFSAAVAVGVLRPLDATRIVVEILLQTQLSSALCGISARISCV